MNKRTAIEIKNVSKKYKLYRNRKDQALEALFPFIHRNHNDFYAIKDFNLVIKEGDILGIIGRNGSGKSTLMKLVAGVIQPTTGTVTVKGNLVPLLELGSGFHRDFTGYENIYFYTAVLGYPKKKVLEKTAEIIEFADIGEFIYQPLKNYSSGMKARLAFSVSVNIDPDILILDEVRITFHGINQGPLQQGNHYRKREIAHGWRPRKCHRKVCRRIPGKKSKQEIH
jgi:ABC-type polysaccharide/polyol phosphate transport system ATPase subunit